MTLRDKMLAVIADTNDSVAEREELVEMIAIALLTRKNLFVLGEPGQAKSYAINLFRRHITGARQFERLLSKQSDEEQLFGRVDLASLLPGSVPPTVLEQDATYQNQRFNLRVLVEGIGSMKDEPATWEKLKSGTEKLELYRAALSALHKSEPTVQTAGKIPEADIVLLDEIFKCNDGVLNSLLTALNERKYTNEGRTYPIPVISFFAASNEIPNFNDPQEKILEALYDRLELKVVTANMEDRGTRLAVLKNKQTGAFGQISATITLEELRQMQQEVASIPVPDAINEMEHRRSFTGHIQKAFEMHRKPTPKQQEYIDLWQDRKIPLDLITYAYEKTLESIDKLSFPYLDSILTRWMNAGYRTRTDVDTKDRPETGDKKAAAKNAVPKSDNAEAYQSFIRNLEP